MPNYNIREEHYAPVKGQPEEHITWGEPSDRENSGLYGTIEHVSEELGILQGVIEDNYQLPNNKEDMAYYGGSDHLYWLKLKQGAWDLLLQHTEEFARDLSAAVKEARAGKHSQARQRIIK